MITQGALLNSWRHNLAVLASLARGPADLDAILRLGDRLAGACAFGTLRKRCSGSGSGGLVSGLACVQRTSCRVRRGVKGGRASSAQHVLSIRT